MRSIADIFRSYAVFDAQGRHVNGTDKQSNHAYGDAYESMFVSSELQDVKVTDRRIEPMHIARSTRDDVRLVMEVGVADGSCLLAWREVFPNALIVGMDIHHSDKAHGERLEFHFGNQRCKADCEAAAAGREFDMIVEDATHDLGASLITLLYLWPHVRPGGLYVVEEFSGIGSLQDNVQELWPDLARVVVTKGPFGGIEPLVVFRKPS